MDILFGKNQVPVIISFFICGILSGVLFDLLKIKRRILGANKFILFIDDFAFMILCGIIVIFNAYSFNNGNMKWYEIPDMVSGFIVYRKTVSVIFIKVCFYIIDKTKKLLYILLLPIKKLIIKIINSTHVVYLNLYMCFIGKKVFVSRLVK